ncbi:hypothetical protein NQ314_000416 [Rhamnusium bicolor]|uniref:Uncharacterized protein n=1 Tax=Rhamnusium bicolor TaxID=1586634 RepID=A0AAV8ZW51_9CUCU|nr:hypothetical protein NQ314_000416 [Rhamnusium bicolor]
MSLIKRRDVITDNKCFIDPWPLLDKGQLAVLTIFLFQFSGGREREKKFQKAALGLADSDDEDLEHDIDQQIESMFATKRTVKEIKAPLGLINTASMGNINTAVDKLELAKRLASKINLTKNTILDCKFATQQAAESILKGSGSQPPITAKTVAEQLAAKLNTKLNYQPKDDEDRMDDDSEQSV